MKHFYLLLMSIFGLMILSASGQVPQKMSYQSVIVDNNDQLVINQNIGVRLSIHQSSPSGAEVYSETHTATTNANALLSIEIGTGNTIDDFSTIDWSNGPYYIESEVDPAGGTNYTVSGVSELLSVPYALYSLNSADGGGGSGFPANPSNGDVVTYDGTNWVASGLATANTGDNASFSIMQPSLALTYCIALVGIYPSRTSPEPHLGEIAIYPYSFVPANWAACEGQMLSTTSDAALFSLLGTAFGGDGTTTFALPDLRGRTVIGEGQGPSLSNYNRGQKVGSETQSLNTSNLPAHNHNITFE